MVKLFPYQIEALEGLPKNVLLAFDTGTGKTYASLEHYKRHNWRGALLIVAPASKVRTGDWDAAIKSYFGDVKVPYMVLSYEAMTKRADDFVGPGLTIIADECHYVCNATSRRSRAFLKIARASKQWIMLSATPLPNGWKSAETYSILTGLSKNKTAFVQRFERIDRSRGFPIYLGYNEEPLLAQWWSSFAKPLPRTGDLMLPSVNIPVSLDMKPGLLRTYAKAVKERVYNDEPLDNPSKVFTTLRRIPTPARVEALQSIIDGTDENVIVFYNYDQERDEVLAMLNKSFKGRKIYEQSGHASKLPNRSAWKKLVSSITLVQYQSGSAAIELQYASITVYLSPPTSYSNYEQSRGRNLRYGQQKTVLFYHVAIEKSLDRHIWGILAQKRDFSTAIMQNTIASLNNDMI